MSAPNRYALIAVAVFAAAAQAQSADSGAALAKASRCYACHDATRVLIGPPYQAIAQRYANDRQAMENVLARKILVGGGGNWGVVPMVPNEHVSQGEALILARWVLDQRPQQAGSNITGSYWKLVELRGQPVPKLPREPHIILNAEGRVTGFAGCNSLTGAYSLDQAALRIRFGQMASTMMACAQGMDTEQAFNEVLGMVDNYSISGDSLALNRARMAPLARFEAVHTR